MSCAAHEQLDLCIVLTSPQQKSVGPLRLRLGAYPASVPPPPPPVVGAKVHTIYFFIHISSHLAWGYGCALSFFESFSFIFFCPFVFVRGCVAVQAQRGYAVGNTAFTD